MSIPGTEPDTTAANSDSAPPVEDIRSLDEQAAPAAGAKVSDAPYAPGSSADTLQGGADQAHAPETVLADPAYADPGSAAPPTLNVPFGVPVNPSVLPNGRRPAPPPIVRQRRPAARRARLTLSRLDPWSVLKTSFVFATCLFIVWMIAVIVLFSILNGAGVFKSINDTLSDVLGTHISFSGFAIIGGAAILGAFNVVLVSALGTVIAFAYNVTASLIGGVEVTLTESE